MTSLSKCEPQMHPLDAQFDICCSLHALLLQLMGRTANNAIMAPRCHFMLHRPLRPLTILWCIASRVSNAVSCFCLHVWFWPEVNMQLYLRHAGVEIPTALLTLHIHITYVTEVPCHCCNQLCMSFWSGARLQDSSEDHFQIALLDIDVDVTSKVAMPASASSMSQMTCHNSVK